MKTLPAHITAGITSRASTLARCLRIERLDGQVFAFTEHDADIDFDGDTYLASGALSLSTTKLSGDLAVDDSEAQGAQEATGIGQSEVLAGLFDGARWQLFEVDWTQPWLGANPLGWGWFGRVRAVGQRVTAELLGPTVQLQRAIGEIYQPGCRANLGDARCKVSLAAHTFSGEVTAVTDNRVFDVTGAGSPPDSLTPPTGDDAYFAGGLLTWTSGANEGVSMEVSSLEGSTLTLLLPMPTDVEAGDTFTLVAGCDHTITTCRDRFNNVLNFRGEPHAPVSDDTIKGP